MLFSGTCYLEVSGVSSLSSRGFSLQFDLKVSAAAQNMEVIKEITENKFFVKVNPSTAQVRLKLDA